MKEEDQEGRYVYCVVGYNGQDFSANGIDNDKVYPVVYDGIAAIVHNCPAKPYESKDENKVTMWILSHHDVMEKAMKKFSSVIPFTFDTIIKGDEENIKEWLRKGTRKLKKTLRKFKNKLEFTVQVFIDAENIKKGIEESNLEAIQIKEQIKSSPKGTAFMLGKKLEKIIKEKLSLRAESYSTISYNTIFEIPDEIKKEGLKKIADKKLEDKEMILNLSCLVDKSKVDKLGKALEEIGKIANLYVRFTGPWAPYSFVESVGGLK